MSWNSGCTTRCLVEIAACAVVSYWTLRAYIDMMCVHTMSVSLFVHAQSLKLMCFLFVMCVRARACGCVCVYVCEWCVPTRVCCINKNLEDQSSLLRSRNRAHKSKVEAAPCRQCRRFPPHKTCRTQEPAPWGTTCRASQCRASRQQCRLRSRTTEGMPRLKKIASPSGSRNLRRRYTAWAAHRCQRSSFLAGKQFRLQLQHLLGTQTLAQLCTSQAPQAHQHTMSPGGTKILQQWILPQDSSCQGQRSTAPCQQYLRRRRTAPGKQCRRPVKTQAGSNCQPEPCCKAWAERTRHRSSCLAGTCPARHQCRSLGNTPRAPPHTLSGHCLVHRGMRNLPSSTGFSGSDDVRA
jgi:hypothetical protein